MRPARSSVGQVSCVTRTASFSAGAFFGRTSAGIGGIMALASLLDDERSADAMRPASVRSAACAGFPHFAPRAKRVIYLFQSGGPSQMDLFDYKPRLRRPAGRPSCPTRSAWASG